MCKYVLVGKNNREDQEYQYMYYFDKQGNLSDDYDSLEDVRLSHVYGSCSERISKLCSEFKVSRDCGAIISPQSSFIELEIYILKKRKCNNLWKKDNIHKYECVERFDFHEHAPREKFKELDDKIKMGDLKSEDIL